MTHTRRPARLLVPLASSACVALACSGPALAAPTSSPLPRSQYAVKRVCSTPLPGRSACMASELVPRSGEARAHRHPLGVPLIVQPSAPSPAAGDYGLRPQDLHSAYSLPANAPATQTIAIVDASNDPAAEADLRTYDEEFGLPECTTANGCFKQVNEKGETSNLPFPKTAAELKTARTTKPALAEEATGWGLEISLDIETAHAVCQSCNILLVEASSPLNSHLEAAEHAAETLGADEISNSWGGPEEGATEAEEQTGPFDHPGTVITASAGDNGYLDWDSASPGSVEFPAASPHVVAVGGTRLNLGAKGAWAGESVWNGLGAGGGGCSTVFLAPAWQSALAGWSGVGCAGDRAVADISADADPYTGVAVADSLSPECEYTYTEGATKHTQHWCTLGGTSLASPLIAAVFALAGGSHGVDYPAETLYANAGGAAAALHDVIAGSNGECSQPYNQSTGLSGCTTQQEAEACGGGGICLAGAGYDGPTGLGTPAGIGAFEPGGSEESVKGGGGEEGGEELAPGGEPPPVASGGGTGAQAPGSGSGEAPGEPGGGEDEKPEAEAAVAGVISALALTPETTLAAQSSRHRFSQLGFTFFASAATRVHVSLAKRVVTRRHARWHKLHRNATISAKSGRNASKLATGPLAAGAYRLTLKPAHGAARSLIIHVR